MFTMGKPLQIRDVPEAMHAVLRARADRAGLSLAAYALQVLEREVSRPTLDEVLDRVATRSGGRVRAEEAVAALDAERDRTA